MLSLHPALVLAPAPALTAAHTATAILQIAQPAVHHTNNKSGHDNIDDNQVITNREPTDDLRGHHDVLQQHVDQLQGPQAKEGMRLDLEISIFCLGHISIPERMGEKFNHTNKTEN